MTQAPENPDTSWHGDHRLNRDGHKPAREEMVTLEPESSGFPTLQELVMLNDLVDATALGLAVWNRYGEVVECNERAAHLLGFEDGGPPYPPAGEQVTGFITDTGESYNVDEFPVMIAIRESRSVKNVVVGINRTDQPRRWLSMSATPVTIEGKFNGAVSALIDLTSEIERRKMLELMTDVNLLGAATGDEDKLLQGLCELLVETGEYPLAWIGVAGEAEGSLEILCAAGKTDYLFEGIVSASRESPRGQGATGSAFRERSIHIANNFQLDANYAPWRERAHQFELSSAIAVPLDVSTPTVMTVYSRNTVAFNDVIASGFVDIAHSMELQYALLRSLAQTEDALEGTIRALAVMTEIRDPYTHGHQRRVGRLASAIAQALGLEPSLVKLIHLGGTVHDIGKIRVPAEILIRPGKLTTLEYELVKEHCQTGAEILSSASLDPLMAEIALHHHERLDGSGYPDALSGDEISLPARIIAVADVIEAMTNIRPYRAALGFDVAMDEIASGKGTKFDALVVETCVAVFRGGFEINDEGGAA